MSGNTCRVMRRSVVALALCVALSACASPGPPASLPTFVPSATSPQSSIAQPSPSQVASGTPNPGPSQSPAPASSPSAPSPSPEPTVVSSPTVTPSPSPSASPQTDGLVRIVCSHLDLATCVADVASVPVDRVTGVARMAVVDIDCGNAICLAPMPVDVAFLPSGATIESVRADLPRTYRVTRTAGQSVTSRVGFVGDGFRALLTYVLGPAFSQPSPFASTAPIVCSGPASGLCAELIRDALAAYPRYATANGVAVVNECPPGAWCPALTTYAVAFLVGVPSTASPWPPVLRVVPAFDGSPEQITPGGGGALLPVYITDVIRAAGWPPNP